MTNVVSIDGNPVRPKGEPNPALVESLEALLEDARNGDLQCLIGTGFMADGARVSIFANAHPNVYEMAGALAWLQREYMDSIEDGE